MPPKGEMGFCLVPRILEAVGLDVELLGDPTSDSVFFLDDEDLSGENIVTAAG